MPVAAWVLIRVAEDERPSAVSVMSDAITVSWAEIARVRPEPEAVAAEAGRLLPLLALLPADDKEGAAAT